MRLRIDRDALADAVAWVARALPARPVVPVLSGMLIEAGDGLALSCFDYDVSARIDTGAEVAEPGIVLVPGRLLAEITRSLPAGQAEFSDEVDSVCLRCGTAEFTLVKLPAEEYPALPELPSRLGTVDGALLAAAVGQVAPSASRDDTLPMLTGVFAEIEGQTITLAATDRYRLAVRDLSWHPERPGLRAAALIPARALAEAARTMTAGTEVSVALRSARDAPREALDGREAREGPRAAGDVAGPGSGAVSGAADGMIGFESGGRRLTTRLLGGEFLKYSSRFPAEFGSRAEMPPGPLIEAVRRVSLVAERGSPVRLAFTDNAVVIEAGTQGQARATERVPAVFAGEERIIAFNPQYLLDGLTAAAVGAAAGHASRSATPGTRPAEEAPGSTAAARGTAAAGGGSTAAPGSTAAARGGGTAAAGGGSIRLEFTSAVRPAVITWAPGEPAAEPPSFEAGAAEPAAEPSGFEAGAAEPAAEPPGFEAGAAEPAAEPPGQQPASGAGGAEPDFRYLVVPLRIPGDT